MWEYNCKLLELCQDFSVSEIRVPLLSFLCFHLKYFWLKGKKKKEEFILLCNQVCGNSSCSVFFLTSESLKCAFSLLKFK